MLELNEKEVVRLIALAGWNNPCAMVLAEMQREEFMLFTHLEMPKKHLVKAVQP